MLVILGSHFYYHSFIIFFSFALFRFSYCCCYFNIIAFYVYTYIFPFFFFIYFFCYSNNTLKQLRTNDFLRILCYYVCYLLTYEL